MLLFLCYFPFLLYMYSILDTLIYIHMVTFTLNFLVGEVPIYFLLLFQEIIALEAHRKLVKMNVASIHHLFALLIFRSEKDDICICIYVCVSWLPNYNCNGFSTSFNFMREKLPRGSCIAILFRHLHAQLKL